MPEVSHSRSQKAISMSKNIVLANGGAMPKSERRAEYNFISKVHLEIVPMIRDRPSFIGGSDARPAGSFKRHRHIGIYFDRLLRFASRSPAPPPFSGMNTTPAFSSARAIAWMVRSCAPSSPGWVSSRLILGRDTPDASAKSFCSHRSSILAARTCSLVSDKI